MNSFHLDNVHVNDRKYVAQDDLLGWLWFSVGRYQGLAITDITEEYARELLIIASTIQKIAERIENG
jgi:hypothetical protein